MVKSTTTRTAKSTIIAAIALLMLSAPVMARRLTTTQMRENTIRINALELEKVIEQAKDEGIIDENEGDIVFNSGKLNFDFDKSVVKERYYELLRNLRDYVEQKNLRVVIIGHTDSKGSDEYNMKLGMRRAVAVRDKLLEFGMDPSRIIGVESKGESEPIDTNETEEGRFENRRIQFKIEGAEPVIVQPQQ
jgi:hypothetical protein